MTSLSRPLASGQDGHHLFLLLSFFNLNHYLLEPNNSFLYYFILAAQY